MNYNRIQQGKKRMLKHPISLRIGMILEIPESSKWAKHGFTDGWVDMYYPNESFRDCPRGQWPRRKFHHFKAKPYKNVKQEISSNEY